MAARIYDPYAADYEPPETLGTAKPKIHDPFASDYAPPPPPPPSPTLGDYGRALSAGVAGIPEVIGYGLRKAGVEEFGGKLEEKGREVAESWRDRMTEGGKAAARAPLVTDEGKLGPSPWSTIGLSAAQSLPGMVAMAGPGLALARGVQALKAGPAVAGVLGGGKIAQKVGAGVAPGLGFGTSEGVYSAAQNASQTGAEIRSAPEQQLAQLPAYQEALARTGDPAAAREEIANAGENQVFNRTALTTGGISAVTGGGAFGQLLNPAKGGVIRRALAGGGREALQEAPQSGTEKYYQNLAAQKYLDPTRQPGEGVWNATALGAATGGVLGLATGSVSPRAAEPPPGTPPPLAPPSVPPAPSGPVSRALGTVSAGPPASSGQPSFPGASPQGLPPGLLETPEDVPRESTRAEPPSPIPIGGPREETQVQTQAQGQRLDAETAASQLIAIQEAGGALPEIHAAGGGVEGRASPEQGPVALDAGRGAQPSIRQEGRGSPIGREGVQPVRPEGISEVPARAPEAQGQAPGVPLSAVAPAAKAEQVKAQTERIAQGIEEGAHLDTVKAIAAGEERTWKRQEAIAAARVNPDLNLRDNPNGSVTAIGARDRQKDRWVGVGPGGEKEGVARSTTLGTSLPPATPKLNRRGQPAKTAGGVPAVAPPASPPTVQPPPDLPPATEVQVPKPVVAPVPGATPGVTAGPQLPRGTVTGGAGEIGTVFDTVVNEKPSPVKRAVRFAAVDASHAATIKQKTGVDVASYHHSIDNFAIRHTLKEHGDPAREASRRQEAITREDFLRVPDIVENYDTLKSAGQDAKGAPLIRYTKRYDGRTYYVEEVRTKRKELAFKTLWKTRTTKTDAALARPPLLTSETLGRNLSQGEGTVTPETARDKPVAKPPAETAAKPEAKPEVTPPAAKPEPRSSKQPVEAKGKEAKAPPVLPQTDQTKPEAVAGEQRYSRNAKTDTSAFKRWFQQSKIVNRAGAPLVAYHGSADAFTEFDTGYLSRSTGHATSGLGFFFTADRKLADSYAEQASGTRSGGEVMPVYLSIQKPYGMTLAEAQAIESPADARRLADRLKAQGYDGIQVKEEGAIVAFAPEQIKSTRNLGTFDPANPDIRYARERESYTSRVQPHTAASLRSALSDRLGKRAFDRLVGSGQFRIVARDDGLPAHLRHPEGGVRGVYDKGVSTLVAGNIRPGEEFGILLHEMGVHAKLEGVLGPKLYADLMGQVEAAAKLGKTNPNASPFVAAVMAARARVPNDTAARYVNEEILAYLVEARANHDLPLVKRILAAIRAFLLRQGIPLLNITPDDLVALARAAIRSASRGETVQRQAPLPVYGALQRALSNKLPTKGTPEHMQALISLWGRKGLFPWGEYLHSGLPEWFAHQTAAQKALLDGPPSDAATASNFRKAHPAGIPFPRALNIPGYAGLGNLDVSLVKAVAADPQALLDLSRAKAGVKESFTQANISAQRLMVDSVRATIKNAEILDAVIKTIPVDVMNDLVGKQFSSEMLLYDPAVLEDALSVPHESPIPAAVNAAISSLIGAKTPGVTKVMAALAKSARTALERSGAMRALEEHATPSVPQRMVSKLDVLRQLGPLAPGREGAAASGGLPLFARKAKDPDRQITVTDLHGDEIATAGKLTWRNATAWAKSHVRGSHPNDDTGWNISVGSKGIEEAAHRAKTQAELQSFAALSSLIKNAVLVESMADREGRPEIREVHTLYAPLRIGQDLYRAKLIVRDTNMGNKYYGHQLEGLEIEKPNVLGVGREPEGSLGVTRPLGSTVRLGDLLQESKEERAAAPRATSEEGVAQTSETFRSRVGPGGAEGVNPNDTYAPTPSGIRAEEGAGPESTIGATGGPVKGPQAALPPRSTRVLGALKQVANVGAASFRRARATVPDMSREDFDAGVLELREQYGPRIMLESDRAFRALGAEDKAAYVEDPKNKALAFDFQAVYTGVNLDNLPNEFRGEQRYSRGPTPGEAADIQDVLDGEPSPPSPFNEENRRLREEDKTVWNRAKSFWQRNFTPGGLLPAQVFEAKTARDGELGVVELDTENLVGQLDHAVKKVYGKRMEQLTPDERATLQRALTGNMEASLDPRVRIAIAAMRQHIDRMSGMYLQIVERQIAEMTASGDPTAEARAGVLRTITGNLGRYVHRSYRAFDDPKWFNKLPNEVIDAARGYLRGRNIESGMDATEAAEKAERALHTIVKTGTAYDSMEAFVREGKLGAKDLSILIRRKDIAPEIRALLGEHDDPRLNYAKSTSKMARLIWNQRFLDRVREIGMGTFLFDEANAPPGATTKIAADASEVYSPLNGLWTFPEIEQAFKDAVGKENMAEWYRVIVQLNGMIKLGKTVYSPTTQIRNFMSAAFFSLANGHFNMRHTATALQTLRGKNEDYERELVRNGVIRNSAIAGEVMQLVKDSRIEEYLNDKKSTPFHVWRKLTDFAKKSYRNGDDFWKIVGYENEKASLMRVGVPEAQAETEAAERIRNTYPTYSMVGRGIKWLSRFPLAGTFVSFPAEIIRTSGNMIGYIASDYKDAQRRPLAIRRAAGLAMVSGFAYALQAMSMAAMGMDDDEEEAVRRLAAPWQKNANFFFAGRDEEGQLRYLDLSFLDPYNFWKRPITAILRDQPWQDKATSALRDMLIPFLGVDIAAGAIFDVLSNKRRDTGGQIYNKFAEPIDQSVSIANHLRKAVQPGFVSNMERTYRAVKEERTASGKKYDLGDEGMAWVGFRVTTLQPKTALFYRAFEFADAKAAATATLSRTLRSPNDVSASEIASAKADAQRQLSDGYKEMRLIVNAAMKNGLSRSDVIRVLRTSGVALKDIPLLLSNREPSVRISPQQIRNATTNARAIYGPEKAGEIRRRYLEASRLASP